MARKNGYPPRVYTDTQASCSKCKQMKLFSEFGNCKGAPRDMTYWCKECSSKNARKHHNRRKLIDPEYKKSKKNNYIKRNYGITLEEYNAKLTKQMFCSICAIELVLNDPNVHLDHDHGTGKLRDFLCTNCNRGLGHFQDNIENVQRALDYLKRFKS